MKSGSRADAVRRAKSFKLGAAFLLMMISGLIWSSFTLFLVAIESDFGWSRAGISGSYSAFALINAVTAPILGQVLGRFDSRKVLSILSLILGLALCASAYVTSLNQYWFAFGVLGGIGAHCTSSFAVFASLAGRFRKRPATAMAIADAGSGLAGFLGVPVVYWIITDFGWRTAYIVLGLTVAFLGGALHLKAMDKVRHAPQLGRRWSLIRSIPSLAIGVLAISYFFGAAAYHSLMTQQFALFEERYLDQQLIVWIVAAAGLVVFVWRLFSGFLCDRLGPSRVMAMAAVATILMFVALILAFAKGNSFALLFYPLALGVALGGQQVLLANGARKMVSISSYATALGFCRFASGLGMAIGPVVAAYTFDVTRSYFVALVMVAGASAIHFISFQSAVLINRRK